MQAQLQQINSEIWLYERSLEQYSVRGALIAGRERSLVWDLLTHPNDMKPLLPLLENRQFIVAYSHADWDHIWGAAGLPSQHPIIVGHTECLKRFSRDVPLTLQEKRAQEPLIWSEVKLVPPNITFQSELSIDLGSLSVTFHALAGHTLDSIVAFLPDQGILLMGDAVETPLPFVSPESPLSAWIEKLETWEQDSRIVMVIPSHGAIGGREIIRRNIDYLKALSDGSDIEIPEVLNDFYQETHQANLRFRYGRESL